MVSESTGGTSRAADGATETGTTETGPKKRGTHALVAALGDAKPEVDETAFVAPTAVVVGRVSLGPRSSVWYQAVLRGDAEAITVGADSNIQDNCTVHADPGFPVVIGERVTVGHNTVLHGCTIEDEVLIGMGATVLNGAHVEAGSLVAAGALVPQGTYVPSGSLVAGVPAKVRRTLTEEERAAVPANAEGYLLLSEAHRESVGRESVGRESVGPAQEATRRSP